MHLHVHCTSGISGDMLVGAFLDLGLPWEHLQASLNGLALEGWRIRHQQVRKGGRDAVQFQVEWEEQTRHRHLRDILEILQRSKLPEPVQRVAIDLFRTLGEAEAQVHQVPLEQVHFHEVGAVDTIVDITAIAVALDYWKIRSVTSTPVVEGLGSVRYSHGTTELPVPAVRALLTDASWHRIPLDSELVTPTGAAFLNRWVSAYTELSPLLKPAGGVGCGSKDFEHPNVLELQLGDQLLESETLLRLETNLDDVSPQILASCLKLALQEGALDAWASPVWGKKGRLGQQLVLLCTEPNRDALIRWMMKQAGTYGVRVVPVSRLKLLSQHEHFPSEWGPVSVRTGQLGDELLHWKPEHDDVERIAQETGESMLWVEARIREAWGSRIRKHGKDT